MPMAHKDKESKLERHEYAAIHSFISLNEGKLQIVVATGGKARDKIGGGEFDCVS